MLSALLMNCSHSFAIGNYPFIVFPSCMVCSTWCIKMIGTHQLWQSRLPHSNVQLQQTRLLIYLEVLVISSDSKLAFGRYIFHWTWKYGWVAIIWFQSVTCFTFCQCFKCSCATSLLLPTIFFCFPISHSMFILYTIIQ